MGEDVGGGVGENHGGHLVEEEVEGGEGRGGEGGGGEEEGRRGMMRRRRSTWQQGVEANMSTRSGERMPSTDLVGAVEMVGTSRQAGTDPHLRGMHRRLPFFFRNLGNIS